MGKSKCGIACLMLLSVFCIGAVEPAKTLTPTISMFFQVPTPRRHENISLIVQVQNPTEKEVAFSPLLKVVRVFAGIQEDKLSRDIGGSRTGFEDGDVYQVCVVVTAPPPTGNFLPSPIDLRLKYGAPVRSVILDPKESLFQRVDLPPEMELSGDCRISAIIVQKHKEVAASDEVRFTMAPRGD